MNDYYLRIRGIVSGPFSTEELRARIARHELSPIHELSRDGSNWFRAGKIWKELAPTKILNRGIGEHPAAQPTPPATATPRTTGDAESSDGAPPEDDLDDDEADAEDFVPAGETRRGKDAELRSLSKLTGFAIVVLIGVLAWCLVFDWFKLETIGHASQAALDDADRFAQGLHGPHLVRMVMECVVGVLFLLWIYNTSEYLHRETGGHMKFSPRWSVGWFFIPVANLWKPYQVVNELRDKSERLTETGLRFRVPFAIVPAWWAAWLGSIVAFRVLGAYGRFLLNAIHGPWESKAKQLHYQMQIPVVLKNALLIEMLCLLIDLVAMVLTVVLIYEIDKLRPHHDPTTADAERTQ